MSLHVGHSSVSLATPARVISNILLKGSFKHGAQEPGPPALHGTACPRQPTCLQDGVAQPLSHLVLAAGCRSHVPGNGESCCGQRDCVSHALTSVSRKVADGDLRQAWILCCQENEGLWFQKEFVCPEDPHSRGCTFFALVP